MDNSVIVNSERRMSDTALATLCVLLTVGIGLTVSYCSGIFGRVPYASAFPFMLPKWLVIALPPVLFVHMGISLYLVIRDNVYTDNDRTVRGWYWAFWVTTFIATAITPYFIYHGMPVAAYIMASITTALALGTTILSYRQSNASGVVMTIFFIVTALLMIYLGYWALS